MAGGIAKQVIEKIKITAFVSSVGSIVLKKPYQQLDFKTIEENPVRCADPETSLLMENYIKEVKKNGDTVGGVISCVIQNVPVGLREPVFDKLHGSDRKAMPVSYTHLTLPTIYSV